MEQKPELDKKWLDAFQAEVKRVKGMSAEQLVQEFEKLQESVKELRARQTGIRVVAERGVEEAKRKLGV